MSTPSNVVQGMAGPSLLRGHLPASILLALLMLLGAALAAYMKPSASRDAVGNMDLEAMIPKQFDDWKIDSSIIPVIPSPDVQENLNDVYDGLISRTYINARGERIMLAIGFTAQQGGKQKPHWQEICYRAQGFDVRNLTRVQAGVAGRTIPVTRMLTTQRTRVEPVTYWVTLGDRVVKDRTERFGYLLLNSLERKAAGGFLFRVSTLGSESKSAFESHIRFADALLAHLPDSEAAKLVGKR